MSRDPTISFYFFIINLKVSVTSEENHIWHLEIWKQDFHEDVPLCSLFVLDPPEEADEDAVSYFSSTEA